MYCEPLDLLQDIPLLHLIALVNDENRAPYNQESNPDGWVFDGTQASNDDLAYLRAWKACEDADATINPYLVERFALPLTVSCPKLNKIARALALSYLYSRRGIIYSADFVKNLQSVLTDLENIKDGILMLPELESLITPIRNISNKTAGDKFLTNELLNNY